MLVSYSFDHQKQIEQKAFDHSKLNSVQLFVRPLIQ